MADDPISALRAVSEVVSTARRDSADREQLLYALAALRLLRDEIGAWEPELITAARARGASWAALAPALGVASRQAAERRYLRLKPSATGETTGEARVDAQRGRRAGDRAVTAWARENSASLRKLAGQVSAANGLDVEGQASADRVGYALGSDDAAALLSPLAATQPHLTGSLAEQVGTVAEHTNRLRRDAIGNRRNRNR